MLRAEANFLRSIEPTLTTTYTLFLLFLVQGLASYLRRGKNSDILLFIRYLSSLNGVYSILILNSFYRTSCPLICYLSHNWSFMLTVITNLFNKIRYFITPNFSQFSYFIISSAVSFSL